MAKFIFLIVRPAISKSRHFHPLALLEMLALLEQPVLLFRVLRLFPQQTNPNAACFLLFRSLLHEQKENEKKVSA